LFQVASDGKTRKGWNETAYEGNKGREETEKAIKTEKKFLVEFQRVFFFVNKIQKYSPGPIN
jgi:hypothetical protein